MGGTHEGWGEINYNPCIEETLHFPFEFNSLGIWLERKGVNHAQCKVYDTNRNLMDDSLSLVKKW